MNDVMLKGQWKQLTGKLKTRWGLLTHDEYRIAAGTNEYLAGKAEERYGIAIDAALRQIRNDRRQTNDWL